MQKAICDNSDVESRGAAHAWSDRMARIGEERWAVDWIKTADLPQSFLEDPDRDLGDALAHEHRKEFRTKAAAVKFAESLTGLFFGVSTVVHLRYQVEFDECGPEWVVIDDEQIESATTTEATP